MVDAIARVKTAQRRVGNIPVPGIEANTLIDKFRLVARYRLLRGLALVAEKNCLAAVGVARPLVEDQHPGEVMQVFPLAQLLVGKEIMQCELPRIPRIAGAKLKPGLAGNPRA